MREFRQLQQYAATLSELMAEAQALEQQVAEATDSSGAIRVVLDTSGLPETIWVDHDWQRDIEPEALGAAVLDAAQAAGARRMEAWAEALDEKDLGHRLDSLGDDPLAPSAGIPGGAPAPFAPPPSTPVNPRPLDELAEDMLAELDRALEQTDPSPQPTVTFTGTDAQGQVSVTLAEGGLVSCTVDDYWAARQSGQDLTAALAQALQSARAQLSSAPREPSPTGHLDQLLSEAMGILSDPKRLTD